MGRGCVMEGCRQVQVQRGKQASKEVERRKEIEARKAGREEQDAGVSSEVGRLPPSPALPPAPSAPALLHSSVHPLSVHCPAVMPKTCQSVAGKGEKGTLSQGQGTGSRYHESEKAQKNKNTELSQHRPLSTKVYEK